ncbi:hypothetical protein EW146_g1900 [Bondarzewia mesenterica]|uniref:Uncharacterized protein n=1 Tax=Bondarzewia mesenterica TaxID=1095465 RepID=A0A4S4M277_9AGAM|nr:hypothetical protein EW146_g1900 [Bondarzewia mesenterica]
MQLQPKQTKRPSRDTQSRGGGGQEDREVVQRHEASHKTRPHPTISLTIYRVAGAAGNNDISVWDVKTLVTTVQSGAKLRDSDQEDLEAETLVVRQVSENAKELLGLSSRYLFSLPCLSDVLPDTQADVLWDNNPYFTDPDAPCVYGKRFHPNADERGIKMGSTYHPSADERTKNFQDVPSHPRMDDPRLYGCPIDARKVDVALAVQQLIKLEKQRGVSGDAQDSSMVEGEELGNLEEGEDEDEVED